MFVALLNLSGEVLTKKIIPDEVLVVEHVMEVQDEPNPYSAALWTSSPASSVAQRSP